MEFSSVIIPSSYLGPHAACLVRLLTGRPGPFASHTDRVHPLSASHREGIGSRWHGSARHRPPSPRTRRDLDPDPTHLARVGENPPSPGRHYLGIGSIASFLGKQSLVPRTDRLVCCCGILLCRDPRIQNFLSGMWVGGWVGVELIRAPTLSSIFVRVWEGNVLDILSGHSARRFGGAGTWPAHDQLQS